MILDRIENSGKCEQISPAFSQAMKYLYEHRDGQMEADRVELSGDVYIMRNAYATKEETECGFEAHRDFIDVQYMASGSECISWAPKESLTEKAYLEQKDFYQLEGDGTKIELKAGQFMIFFPDDGHMPGVKCGESAPVIKLVAKIRVGK